MRCLTLLALFAVACPARAEQKLTILAGGDKSLHQPFGMGFTPGGTLVLVELGGHRVVEVGADGKARTLAGSGENGFADGPAPMAKFNGPHNLVVAGNGDIYVADTLGHRVRKVDGKTRVVSTVAGTGEKGFGGDGGPARDAKLDQAYHVALDRDGTGLLVCDLGNRRIRKIDLKAGTIGTVVGNGQRAEPADGTPALEAPLVDPRAVEIDKEGRIWILERSGHALRVVEDGKIRTVAGTGKKGAGGDGGPALKAELNGPKFLWIDPAGDVLIADTENHVIRKYVVKTGMIERVAGTGTKGSGGLEKGLLGVELTQPHGVAIGPDGALYIADSMNHRILKAK